MAGTEGTAPIRDADSHRRLRLLRRNAKSYKKGLEDAQQLAHESKLHVDQSLTWAIGLMGAGLASLVTTIKALYPAASGWALLVAALPWGLAIFVAILGRIVFITYRDADVLAFFGQTKKIEALLVRDRDALTFGTELLEIIRDESWYPPLQRWRAWMNVTYYVAYGLFAAGILSAFGAAIYCARHAPPQGGGGF